MAPAFIVAGITAALVGVPAFSSADSENFNPDLQRQCGLDVVLVLDGSESLGDSPADGDYFLPDVEASANAFINAFAETGTNVGVVMYAKTAGVLLPMTPVTTASTSAGGAHSAATGSYVTTAQLDNNPGGLGTYTNWEDGLLKAQATLNAGARGNGIPTLVVHVTDGAPSAFFDPTGTAPDADGLNDGIAAGFINSLTAGAAEVVADSIQAAGTHILTVGVGQGLNNPQYQTYMQQASGNDQVVIPGGNFDPVTTDVILTQDFALLESIMKEFALKVCSPSISITKLASSPDALDTFEPAAGVGFTAITTATDGFTWVLPNGATGTSQQVVTNDAGLAQFQWDVQFDDLWGDGQVMIIEDPPPGFVFDSISCTRTNQDVSNEVFVPEFVDGAMTLNLGLAEITSCEIRNRAIDPNEPGSLTINKTALDGSGGPGSSWFNFTSPQLGDFTIKAPEGTGSQTFDEIDPGTYEVMEYLGPRWELAEVVCSNGSPAEAIVVGPGEDVTCTFTNRMVGPAKITINKVARDADGNRVDATFEFVSDALGRFFITTTNGFGFAHFEVQNGTYDIWELAPENFHIEEVVCSDGFEWTHGGSKDGHFINVGIDDHVACTFFNQVNGPPSCECTPGGTKGTDGSADGAVATDGGVDGSADGAIATDGGADGGGSPLTADGGTKPASGWTPKLN